VLLFTEPGLRVALVRKTFSRGGANDSVYDFTDAFDTALGHTKIRAIALSVRFTLRLDFPFLKHGTRTARHDEG